MSGVAVPNRRSTQTLRILAAFPGGLSARDIFTQLKGKNEKLLRTNMTDILRSCDAAGYIERAEKKRRPGSRGRCFVDIWRITPAGTAFLVSIDAQEESRVDAEEMQRRCHAALALAARLYSRATPPRERRAAIVRLRELGCRQEEIARVFGVTRQYVSLELKKAAS